MDTWHLQLRTTTWVLWGYGPNGFKHIEAASIKLDIGKGLKPLSLDFELPEKREGSTLGAPVEYERKEAVGWRFQHSGGECTWNLAATEEEALAAAQVWAEFHDAERPWATRKWVDSVKDVRRS